MPDVSGEASVTALFFGRLSDRFGRSAVLPIPVSGARIADLRLRLEATLEPSDVKPSLWLGTRAAVDKVVATDDALVLPGQEVAFFSAVSGG